MLGDCKGRTYVNTVIPVSKTSKCEYMPTYLHLSKCAYTVPSSFMSVIRRRQIPSGVTLCGDAKYR